MTVPLTPRALALSSRGRTSAHQHEPGVSLSERLRPIRLRRAELAADPGHLLDVLAGGNTAANRLADATLAKVRQLMHMNYLPVA